MIGAYISDVSATVTHRKLVDENKTLNNLANYDRLTGLQSRRMFMERIKDSEDNKSVVICIDVYKRQVYATAEIIAIYIRSAIDARVNPEILPPVAIPTTTRIIPPKKN